MRLSPVDTLDGTCLAKTSQSMGKSLAQIAGALRKAGTANTQFVGSTYYNPLLATWLLGDDGQKAAKASVPLIEAGNAGIAQVYKAVGFKVADVARAYRSDDFGHPVNLPGAGKVPENVAEICKLTWACTPKRDPHPNAVGHKVIAAAFAAQFSQVSELEQQPASGPSISSAPGAAKNAGDAGANKPTADGDLAETGAPSSAPPRRRFRSRRRAGRHRRGLLRPQAPYGHSELTVRQRSPCARSGPFAECRGRPVSAWNSMRPVPSPQGAPRPWRSRPLRQWPHWAVLGPGRELGSGCSVCRRACSARPSVG
ncbi:hypothetical protein ACGFNV_36355 [Streptomyces sp. NPDC048751]|uniref:hypothetical protein n=1 Tax=Streptomyces sp. NPDC048751 TaxID=3365591 RepID=UPI0037103A62